MTPGNCRTCRYWVQPDEKVDQGFCHKDPPQVFPYMAPGPLAGQGQMRLQSFFPPVSGGTSCWKWSVDEKGQKN